MCKVWCFRVFVGIFDSNIDFVFCEFLEDFFCFFFDLYGKFVCGWYDKNRDVVSKFLFVLGEYVLDGG